MILDIVDVKSVFICLPIDDVMHVYKWIFMDTCSCEQWESSVAKCMLCISIYLHSWSVLIARDCLMTTGETAFL